MRTLFHQRERKKIRSPGSFFALLYWLVDFILLTEEEQTAAGIFLDGSYDDIHKK